MNANGGSGIMKVLFLGSGTSSGVPTIGCTCPVCTSSDPRNTRLRPSVYISHGGYGLLLDASPDFRQQAMRYKIPRVDAVLITHSHADHVFGLDDLRRYNTIQNSRIPLYAIPSTVKDLDRIFEYFHNIPLPGTYLPAVDFNAVSGPFDCGPFRVTPFAVEHGRSPACGFRIDLRGSGKSFSYASDCRRFPDESVDIVRDTDVMVLDALRYREHASHMTVEQSVETLRKIGAPRSFLTHMAHDIDHAVLAAALPPSIAPAYDGLQVEI